MLLFAQRGNQLTMTCNPLIQSSPALFSFALDSIVIIWQWQKRARYPGATRLPYILSGNTTQGVGGQAQTNAWEQQILLQQSHSHFQLHRHKFRCLISVHWVKRNHVTLSPKLYSSVDVLTVQIMCYGENEALFRPLIPTPGQHLAHEKHTHPQQRAAGTSQCCEGTKWMGWVFEQQGKCITKLSSLQTKTTTKTAPTCTVPF